MIDEQDKDTRPSMKIVRTADHRSHYVIGAIPQWTEEDLRLHMYNETIEGLGGPYYISTTQIIIPRRIVPKLLETLRSAIRKSDIPVLSEAGSAPLEVALAVDKEILESKKAAPKKKVKIKVR